MAEYSKIDYRAVVMAIDGKDQLAPETDYLFSNGRRFLRGDADGIYAPDIQAAIDAEQSSK